MSNIINFRDLKIAREISPLIKVSKKRIFGKKSKKKGKILIVDTCIVGDFLATLPALRAFIRKNKRNVDIIVSPAVRTLAESVKGVEKVFIAKTSYDKKNDNKKYIIEDNYELIVVLRISPESYDLIKDLNAKMITSGKVYFKYIFNMLNSIFFKREVKQSREAIYEIVGLKMPHKINLDDIFNISKDEEKFLSKIPEIYGNEKKIIIHTGSGWGIRQWENAKWIELINKINSLGKFKFIFIGNDDTERKSYEFIRNKLKFKVYSLIGKIDLRETFIIMKKCDYFIGIDSGPRNLAHLADLRSVTLLNPVAVKNFMPFNKKDVLIDKRNRFPIHLFNFRNGSKMKEISSEEVFEAFKKLL